MSSLDLVSEEFFWRSGAYRLVADGAGATRPIIGPGWRMSRDETRIERAAPKLGEHNRYVYGDLLGLSASEIAALTANKAIY
jgi:crotonobetainyl-CoA:carnitine CoA-transferase CaiB-like acyl-CoA transferase